MCRRLGRGWCEGHGGVRDTHAPAGPGLSACRALSFVLFATAWAWPAMAGAPRDIVFDCPCGAEWTAGRPGVAGALTLTAGLRSFRATDSGEVRLTAGSADTGYRLPDVEANSASPSAGHVDGRATLVAQRRTMDFARPAPGAAIAVTLWETAAEFPADASAKETWTRHETLVLWPTADDAGTDRIEYVDILTDTDGDGAGDVNERLAGTSTEDPASTPGTSTIRPIQKSCAIGFRVMKAPQQLASELIPSAWSPVEAPNEVWMSVVERL